MKSLIAKSVLVLGLVAAAPVMAGDATAGKALTEACGACHGADGNSVMATFPKLAGQSEKYLLKQLHDIKSGERKVPEMTGQLDQLSDTDLANIAAYFAGNTMALSGSKDDKELLALGAKIYRAGNKDVGVPACIGCHSPTGAGNAPAGFPRLGGQHADYIAKQLRDFRAGAEYTDKGRHNDGDIKIMRAGVARMSDKEIDAVANYIAGLH
ncbi:MAG TPA: c-type cytochrome [Pseudomonadales bacterium]|nr:c-type cytochrome [Pseudomonadales bacterium]